MFVSMLHQLRDSADDNVLGSEKGSQLENRRRGGSLVRGRMMPVMKTGMMNCLQEIVSLIMNLKCR